MVGPACAQAQGNGQQSDSQKQNTQPEQPKPSPIQPSVSGAAVQPKAADQILAQAEIYKPNCRQPKNHDEADLCAQWRVAEAAENTLQLTLAQTAIGALGVLFVVVTLGFTARANKAAAIAAQAAVDAVGFERAWLSSGPPQIVSGTNVTDPDGVTHSHGIGFAITWINTGRSPALQAIATTKVRLIDHDADIPVFSFEDPEQFDHTTVGPNMNVTSPRAWLVGKDHEKFVSRTKSAIVYSKVYYKTIASSERRYTETCLRFVYNGVRTDDNNKSSINYDIFSAGHQNSAT